MLKRYVGICLLSLGSDMLKLLRMQNKKLPWQNYLLPAATSEQLGVQMSQLVDYAWGDSIYDMLDIMDNKAAMKVFRGMRILCVSPAFIEPKKVSSPGAHSWLGRMLISCCEYEGFHDRNSRP